MKQDLVKINFDFKEQLSQAKGLCRFDSADISAIYYINGQAIGESDVILVFVYLPQTLETSIYVVPVDAEDKLREECNANMKL